jgi:hypothetical protein
MSISLKKEAPVRAFVGRGRPRKSIVINRKLSVNQEDYKLAISLMSTGKSLTKIEKSTSMNLKALRAIRKYAIENNLVAKKKSAVEANVKRQSKVAISPVTTATPVVSEVETLVTLEENKPVLMTERTLTIDFKGIIMQVQISSVEVQGDSIIVR